jgi:thiol-disulfide isomerase/thioredoxin
VVVQLVAAAYAALFAAAALGKATAWESWSALAEDVAGKAKPVVRPAVPAGEVALAVALIVVPAFGLAATAGALGLFAVVVIRVRGRLAGRDCGCFGRFSSGKLSGRLAARNAVLAAAAAGLAPFAGTEPLRWWSVAPAVAAWVGYAGLRRLPARDPVGAGAASLLVFVRQDCGPCRRLVPHLEEWQRNLAGAVAVIPVDLADDPRLAARYGVHATPTAVAIGQEGEVGRVEGEAAIVALAKRLAGELATPSIWRTSMSRRSLLGQGAGAFAGMFALPALLRAPGRAAADCDYCIKARCSCNGKVYDSASDCTSECHASLGCFTGICDPVPTNQVRCGSKCCDPGQKCVNGQCMDQCPPDYKPCGCGCCPPGQECEGGRCKGKNCGGDISDALGEAVSRTKNEFGKWDNDTKDELCGNLVSVLKGTFAWDVHELSPGGRKELTKSFGPECSSCGDSVQIGSGCHFDGSANYVIFGTMMRLCHDYYDAAGSDWKAGWHDKDAVIDLVAIHKSITGLPAANLRASAEWAAAGYDGWPGDALTPDGDRPKCETSCPNKYSGKGLVVQWYPKFIRP